MHLDRTGGMTMFSHATLIPFASTLTRREKEPGTEELPDEHQAMTLRQKGPTDVSLGFSLHRVSLPAHALRRGEPD